MLATVADLDSAIRSVCLAAPAGIFLVEGGALRFAYDIGPTDSTDVMALSGTVEEFAPEWLAQVGEAGLLTLIGDRMEAMGWS